MRTKKALITVLCFLLMFTMVPMSIYADSPTVTVKVEAETTNVNQNDEVSFTVYLEDCSGLAASGGLFNLDFDLVIPTGLTFVAGSAAVDSNFATNTGFAAPAFNPDVHVMKFSSMGALTTGYTGGRIPVMTFKCKVDADAVGSKNVDVTNIVPTDSNGQANTITAVNVPATINIAAPTTYIDSVTATVAAPASGSPLATAATVDSSAGYTVATVTWYEGSEISESAKVDTAASPNAKSETVYTAVIALTAKDTAGYKFKTGSDITATDGYSVVSGGTETALSISKTFDKTLKDGLEVTAVSLNEMYGYTSPTSKTIVIKNISASTNIQVKSVEVNDTTHFEIEGSSQPAINAGDLDNTSFKIKAKTGLNAGTYNATITVTDMSDNTYTAAASLIVARKTLGDISISQNGWMYGADASSIPGYTTSGLDSVSASQLKIEYSVKDANAWSETKPTMPGEYTIKVTVTDANLENKSASCDFTIAKNNTEIKVVANSHEWTYDGNSHSDTGYKVYYGTDVVTTGALPTGDTITAVIEGSVKDVKDNAANNNTVKSITVANRECYTNVTLTSGTLKINPITTQIVVTADSDTRAYNGEALTKNTYTFTDGVLLSGDTLTATVTGTQTYAGASDNTVSDVKVMRGSEDITSNYTFGSHVNGTLTVTAADQPLAIAAQIMRTNSTLSTSELEQALTGAKGNVSFAIKTGITGADYNKDTYGGLRAGSTEGTIVMTATAQPFDVNGDSTPEYSLTTKDFNVTVIKKEEVTFSGIADNQEFTYDGTAKKPAGTLTVVDDKVPVSELTVSYAGIGSTVYSSSVAPIGAGTYSVTYKVPASNATYMGQVTYNFTINKAKLTKVTLSGEYVYDGTVKTAVLNGFDSNTMTKSGAETRTDAGNQNITISLKTPDNYTWADDSTDPLTIAFEVKKAEPAITISNLSQKVGSITAPTYTIAPDKTNGTVKVEYKLSTEGDETYTETLPTAAGTYTVRVSLTGDNNLTNKSETATLQIKSKSNGGGSESYTLIFNTNGGSSIAKISAAKGTEIKLNKYEPTRADYKFAGWYSDKKLENKVTSIKLTENVTVYAAWEKDSSAALPFKDVKPSHWFYNDVMNVFNSGLMNGTSEDTFSPNTAITRGMIVTILYRLENEPAVSGNMPFNDVKAGSYYEKAIIWAAANDIVDGYGDGVFAPNDEITREQLAAILWRYAKYKDCDVSNGADITAYTDANEIHSYAKAAFKWVCGEGVVNGTSETTLSPSGTATRAQAAATLIRLSAAVK